jgi:hypothetical protein
MALTPGKDSTALTLRHPLRSYLRDGVEGKGHWGSTSMREGNQQSNAMVRPALLGQQTLT